MHIKMDSYGDCGWQFTVDDDGDNLDDYRTNINGKGLWRLTTTNNISVATGEYEVVWHQIKSINEFELPLNGASTYAKIRRLWTAEWLR